MFKIDVCRKKELYNLIEQLTEKRDACVCVHIEIFNIKDERNDEKGT